MLRAREAFLQEAGHTRRPHGRTKTTELRAHLYPGHSIMVRHEPLTVRRRPHAPPCRGGGGARNCRSTRRTGLPAASAATMPRRRLAVPSARDDHLSLADARRHRRVAWG